MNWERFSGGAGWRVTPSGRIELENALANISPANRGAYRVDGEGALRTRGEPSTARVLLAEYGGAIKAAAQAHGVSWAVVAAMVTIEARRIPGTRSFDPVSLVDEDARAGLIEVPFHRYRDRPRRVSAGLMQTLLSTARAMQDRYAPPWEPVGAMGHLDLSDLCIPERSLWLGAAYIRHQMATYGSDPVLLVAAYNAGSLRETGKNPWHLRTYGRDRIPKFAAYHNDLLEVGL